MANHFAEITDKLVEALVHVRVARSHDPGIDDFPTQREDNKRIRKEHLDEARRALGEITVLINSIEGVG
jgi:hypothetical protein